MTLTFPPKLNTRVSLCTMMDHVDIGEEALKTVMKRILPKMDARTVTLSKLLEHIQRALGAEKEDLKPWKPLIKVLVGELLHLCPNGADATPTKSTQANRSPHRTPTTPMTTPAPEGGDDGDELDGEIKRKISPMLKAKSKRILVDDSDEEHDGGDENAHPNVNSDRANPSSNNEASYDKVALKKQRDVEDEDESDTASAPRAAFKKKARNAVESSSEDDNYDHPRSKSIKTQIYKRSQSDASSAKRSHSDEGSDSNDARTTKRPSKAKAKSKKRAAREPSDDDDGSEDDSDSKAESSPVKKRSKRGRDESSKGESSSKKPRAAPKSTAPTSSGLETLKQMAKIAGVLAPGLYKKLRDAASVDDAEEILRARLDEANVTWSGRYPGRADMAALKKKKDLERELDGIDPTLILGSTRGTRRSRTAVAFESVAPVEIASDPESEASFDATAFAQDKNAIEDV